MTRNKRRDLISFAMVVLILILLNFAGSFLFHRFDLTQEKRYTLSDATKKVLKSLDDVVYVKVYLEGSFPAGFKRLRNETKEMLDEFRIYANNNIEYEFVNPYEGKDKQQQELVMKQLYEKGLQRFNLEVKDESGVQQMIIFPSALVSYKGKEQPWQLLKTQLYQSADAQLNNSVQALEYEFASTIRNLSLPKKPVVAFIDGHGEADTLQTKDIFESLQTFYNAKRITINEQPNALDSCKAIIIAKPSKAFSEKDKYIIDQFVMKGGAVLWCIDALNMSEDSLVKQSFTEAMPFDLKVDELLFKYGARINNNMVIDMQSSAIQINTAMKGQQPRFELLPWIYYPLITPIGNNPIVKNLEVVKLNFASTIDTLEVGGVKKTILLHTSRNSRVLPAPVRVYLQTVLQKFDERMFNARFLPVAVLLEGQFKSIYRNRVLPKFETQTNSFKDVSVPNKMIVISDGDVICNEIQYSTKQVFPLGYDRNTNKTFGNRNFIMNCVNYLCDDSGLISVRARELTMRLLDKKKIKTERLKWQLLNTLLPLGLVLTFGISYHFLRKRKFTG